jgi:hypothetical protein
MRINTQRVGHSGNWFEAKGTPQRMFRWGYLICFQRWIVHSITSDLLQSLIVGQYVSLQMRILILPATEQDEDWKSVNVQHQ